MTKMLRLGWISLLVAGPAFAADLPVKTPRAIPLPNAFSSVPVYTWTGCYLGGNIGGGWQRTSYSNQDGTGVDIGSNTGSSFVGGGQIGCDYQIGAWVVGVQGLLDEAALKGSVPVPNTRPTVTIFNDNRWFATATTRVGYAIQPTLLLYGKGGAAWTSEEISVEAPPAPAAPFATDKGAGWTTGVGLEYMFAPRWSVFAEYDFLRFGARTVTGIVDGTPHSAEVKQDIQTALIGVTWRLWP
jgi:outer membrane immunogenic protein